MTPVATHYAFSILNTGAKHRKKCTHLYFFQYINQESNENIQRGFHFSSAYCILLTCNWKKTQSNYFKAHFSFGGYC